MHPLIQELIATGPVLTDGAWGTELQARGLPAGAAPDLWNVERPEVVAALARDYVAAGSRILLTNTFGANRILLDRHGRAGETAAINVAGVALARPAAGAGARRKVRPRVFGAVGPTGVLVSMEEDATERVRAAFVEQIEALWLAGVDGIVVETMMDLAEALLAVEAAHETGLPVVACMAFDPARDGRTLMGVTPEQAAAALAAAGADVLGANCGAGPEGLLPICERLRAATTLPLWLKPNAGLPQHHPGTTIPTYATSPEEFAERAMALVRAGASFIGGCCGTGPAFIDRLLR